MILTLEELKKDTKLINEIDWDITPELAVRMYLEWGNIWARGEERKYVVTSKNDYSVYFVVYCWEKPYSIHLLKRNSEDVTELVKIPLPERFEKTVCKLRGVYALEGELKEWLRKELNAV